MPEFPVLGWPFCGWSAKSCLKIERTHSVTHCLDSNVLKEFFQLKLSQFFKLNRRRTICPVPSVPVPGVPPPP